jgi:hypothetical protein
MSFRKAAKPVPGAAAATTTTTTATPPIKAVQGRVIDQPEPPAAETVAEAVTANVAPANTAPAAPAERQLATRSTASAAQLQGDWGAGDVAVPYMTLCQKSGNLFDEFPEALGKYVYDKSICVGDAMRVVVFTMVKYFLEDRPFGDSQIPKRWDSFDAANASGLPFNDVADIHLMVEMDAQDAPSNAFVTGATAWTAAKYTVRSSAYGRTVKFLMRDLPRWLNGDFASGIYEFTVERKTSNGNSYFVPTIKANAATPADLREYIADEFGV